MASTDWTAYAAASLPTDVPHGLEGVWAKLRRAQDHLIELRAATAAYLGMPPYRMERTPDGDGWEIITPQVMFAPPLKLAMIFGDLLHCCDSALDQTAWAFARTQREPPHKRTEWPTYGSADYFETRMRDALRDLPSEVLTVMADMQPFSDHAVGADIGQTLQIIRGLSNEDKHRVLPIITAFVTPHSVGMHAEGPRVEWLDFDGEMFRSLRVPVYSDTRWPPVQMYWDAKVTIRRDEIPWRSGLEGIAEWVYDETTIAIAALRGQWELLRGLPGD